MCLFKRPVFTGHEECPCGCGGVWPVENLAVDQAVLKSNLIFNGPEGDSPPKSFARQHNLIQAHKVCGGFALR